MACPTSADRGEMNIRSKKDLYVLDLPAAERSSAASHVSQPHKANSPFRVHSLGMPGLRAMQANPFIHDVNQQDASSIKSGETGSRGLNGQIAGIRNTRWMVEPDGIEPTT